MVGNLQGGKAHIIFDGGGGQSADFALPSSSVVVESVGWVGRGLTFLLLRPRKCSKLSSARPPGTSPPVRPTGTCTRSQAPLSPLKSVSLHQPKSFEGKDQPVDQPSDPTPASEDQMIEGAMLRVQHSDGTWHATFLGQWEQRISMATLVYFGEWPRAILTTHFY